MKFVKKCIKLIMGFLNAMQEDCVGAYAAQTAYFIMLSFFPFIILLVTLVQYTSLTPADIYKAAQMIFPPSMDSFVLGIIDEVYSKTAVTISLSAIMTAWSAGKGFMGLIQGMNMIYNVEERRNYIILRLQSALYTMVFVVAIILSLVVLVFGNSLHEMAVEYIPILTYVTEIILKMKGMVSVGILAVLFMVLYRFCAEPEGAAHPAGSGRGFRGGVLVCIFYRIFPLCGIFSGSGQYVRQSDHHRAGDAVAVFLYVYHSDWRGDQFLLRGSVPAGVLLPADAAGAEEGTGRSGKELREEAKEKAEKEI